MLADAFIRQFRSWDEFFGACACLPSKCRAPQADKGRAFERLTQLYLRTAPEYQTKLRHVWLAQSELPATVRSQIGLPVNDEGIDLIAQTFSGEFWAIQAKFRVDTGRALTVTELSTFTNLVFTVCRGISLAVVSHTCARPVRKRALLGRATEIGLDRWLALDEEGWRRIHSACRPDKVVARPKPQAPRPHQVAALKEAKAHFVTRGRARGRLVMPCGTGKSLTAFWIARELRSPSVVVAVPSLALIKQTLAVWTREFLAHGERPDWLCVCSDESTGRLEHDEFVGSVYELGVDATTNPAEVRRFLDRRTTGRRIVFSTYQSGRVLAQATRQAGFEFDLGIMDEAHRTVGSADGSFSVLLHDHEIPMRRRLFMTATERIVRGGDETVLSMADEAVYGERFFELSFKQALEARPPILSDYKIVTIAVTDERVHELLATNRYLRVAPDVIEEAREAQELASGVALQRVFQEEGVRHAITFHRSIEAAERFRRQHEQLVAQEATCDRPKCLHVSSRDTAGDRSRTLKSFGEEPLAMITNARCLQEGVDIPAVDGVLFADPKQSKVDIVQAAGRAMRPHPGKRFGYVVIPIVVPPGMDFSRFGETTRFKQVVRVITALSTQDSRIADELRAVGGRPPAKGRIVEFKCEVPVGHQVSLEEFREHLRIQVWRGVGRANFKTHDDASAFVQRLGIRSQSEFRRAFGRLPPDIPTNPNRTYAGGGWVSWGHFFGTRRPGPKDYEFLPFEEARSLIRAHGFKGGSEWRAYSKTQRPPNIPSNPNKVYAGKWRGMGDWLGTGAFAPGAAPIRPFPAARDWARSLGLRNAKRWWAYCKSGRLPADIPRRPDWVYRSSGWTTWGDWLGTGSVSPHGRQYRPFAEAREHVRGLRLSSEPEWRAYAKSDRRPPDIPTAPGVVYRQSGWVGLGDWLGTHRIQTQKREYRSFVAARAFARGLKFRNQLDWRAHARSGQLPADLPWAPDRVYRDRGWCGWRDWLGPAQPKRSRYRAFLDSRAWVHSLHLRTANDWRAHCKTPGFPKDIPHAPNTVYAKAGWRSWPDWLGVEARSGQSEP